MNGEGSRSTPQTPVSDEDAEVFFALSCALEHDDRHQALALRTWWPRIEAWYRASRSETSTRDAEDAARWRQHAEIVRMGGIDDALTVRLTMRENGKVWETQYVVDTAKFGRNTVLGLKAIGMTAEQKAEELFAVMEAPHE